MGKTDVRDIADRVEEPTPEQNDRAVCAVLRCAAHATAGPTVARDVCVMLGLDLLAALRRVRRARAAS
ncbi:MAG: hypothetical protein ACRDTZ_01290 [Pseudonocardiaceae bacterium]